MELLDLMKSRFSCRRFKDYEVEEDKINLIIDSAICAPTAHNNQPFKLTVLKSKDSLAKLSQCSECVYDAPLAFIISGSKSKSWKREFDGKSSIDVDASIVCTQMSLEAESIGLGSCIVMYFEPNKLKEAFITDPDLEPILILLVGYKRNSALPSPYHFNKKSPSDLVEYK